MPDLYALVEIPIMLFDIILYIRFMEQLLSKRKNIHTVIIIPVFYAVQSLKQLLPFDTAKPIVSIIIDIAFFSLLFKDKIIRVIIYVVIYFVFLTICDGITASAFSVLGLYEFKGISEYEVIHIYIALSSRVILPVFVSLFIRFRPKNEKTSFEFFYYPIPICILLILLYFFPLDNNSLYFTRPEWLFLLVCVFMAIAMMCVILAGHFRQKVKVLSVHQKEQSAYIGEVHKAYKGLAVYSHDSKHHFDLINTYILNEQYGRAREYVKTLYTKLDSAFISYTGNADVDSIIHSKQLEAPVNITLSVTGRLPSVIEWMDSADLCILLANALSNAIEACTELENVTIELTFKYSEWMIISVSNPYIEIPPFKDDEYMSNKGTGHGLGLKSMEAIAKKYNGYMSIEAKNGVFTLDIMLQRKR